MHSVVRWMPGHVRWVPLGRVCPACMWYHWVACALHVYHGYHWVACALHNCSLMACQEQVRVWTQLRPWHASKRNKGCPSWRHVDGASAWCAMGDMLCVVRALSRCSNISRFFCSDHSDTYMYRVRVILEPPPVAPWQCPAALVCGAHLVPSSAAG